MTLWLLNRKNTDYFSEFISIKNPLSIFIEQGNFFIYSEKIINSLAHQLSKFLHPLKWIMQFYQFPIHQ